MAPQLPPGAERIDRAGRKGVKFPDGAILWADGEKEVPPSGISDEEKKAMAKAAAGAPSEPTVEGASRQEVADAERLVMALGSPAERNARRRAAAKEAASRKPGVPRPAMPASHDEAEAAAKHAARRLLDKEIDRLDELKAMAIAGTVEVARAGALLDPRRTNPPMLLHDAVLAALRVLEGGDAKAMIDTVRQLKAWHAHGLDGPSTLEDELPPVDDELPYPPGGTPDPLPEAPGDESGRLSQATDDTQQGGRLQIPPEGMIPGSEVPAWETPPAAAAAATVETKKKKKKPAARKKKAAKKKVG